MGEISNTKRFFQLSSSMLFEYEFNEKFNNSRSDKYGEFRIGDFTPIIFPLKDGNRLFTCTTDNNDLFKTNNLVKNIAIPYTEHDDWWFHFDGSDGGSDSDYITINEKLGVKDHGVKFVLKKYTSEETAKLTYEEYLELFYNSLEAAISETQFSLEKILREFDVDICEVLKTDDLMFRTILGVIKEFHTGDYIFKYYDDYNPDWGTIDQEDLTYDTVFQNLLEHGIDYYKGTIHEERVYFALALELWACRNKTRYVSMAAAQGATKLNSLNYLDNDILLYIADKYAEERSNTNIIICTDRIPFDTYRIYFVGGYYLDGIYGFHLRLSATNNEDKQVILSDLLFNKETNIEYQYLDTPLYVSNRIYDRYIEIKIPALKYISVPSNRQTGSISKLAQELNIMDASPIKVEFAIVDADNIYDYYKIDDNTEDALSTIQGANLIDDGKTASLFNTSSIITTLLPQKANSDRIGAHITIPEGKNYLEFGGTWDGERMTYENSIVDFNSKYIMYQLAKVRNENLYDVNPERQTEWIGYHEIIAKFYRSAGEVIDGQDMSEYLVDIQRYNITQPFNAYETSFGNDYMKYRPIIQRNDQVTSVVFEYTFRLINIIDDVQFIKTASYGLSFGEGQSLSDFFNDTLVLDIPVDVPVVYNKIEKVENSIQSGNQNQMATRYNKIYYNSSSVVLNADGTYSGDGTYTMVLSNSPKNYKFLFKQYKDNGDLAFMDLSDASYKLYSRDKDGKDILIEPTYSENMNATLGELEFNIPINTILKLKDVDQTKRFMSVLVVNQDNTKYSMFDFTYE